MTNELFPNIDPKLIDELAKQIKMEHDLAALSRHLMKLTVERALTAELDDHLGYDKHAPEGKRLLANPFKSASNNKKADR